MKMKTEIKAGKNKLYVFVSKASGEDKSKEVVQKVMKGFEFEKEGEINER